MTYTAVPTVNTGDLWTAANHNTYVRDNLAYVLGGLELNLTNKSGGDLVAGDVVVIDPSNDEAFTVSVTQGDEDWIGVLTEDIANDAAGRVAKAGKVTVNVYNTVTRGNFLRVSATTGAAEDAGTTPQAGSFARALTAHAGSTAGTVTAELMYAPHTAGSRGFTAYNNSGEAVVTGEVLTWDSDIARGVSKSSNYQDRLVAGVAVTSMSSGGSAEVGSLRGLEVLVLCTGGSPNVGEWLVQSATAGYAQSTGGYTKPPTGAIGVALTTMGGTSGSIYCMLDIDFYLTKAGGGNVYMLGGYTGSNIATCNKIIGASETSTTVGGAALSAARKGPAASSDNDSKAFIQGGYTSTHVVTADRLTFSSEVTAAVTSANLAAGRSDPRGHSSQTDGYCSGGDTTGGPGASNYKTPFATETRATLSDLPGAKQSCAPADGPTYGYLQGGQTSGYTTVNTVYRVNYSTDVSDSSGGTLASTKTFNAGLFSSTAMYSIGGSGPSSVTEKATFASETWAAVGSAALGTAKGDMGSGSLSYVGYVIGGATSPTIANGSPTGLTTTTERLTFSTDTMAVVAGAALGTNTALGSQSVENQF